MLIVIRNALAASVETAAQGSAGDGSLRHFADEESAARFLREHSTIRGDLFNKKLAPLHKWLQAIYVTDGGALPVGPDHLGKVLDVPFKTALAMLQAMASSRLD